MHNFGTPYIRRQPQIFLIGAGGTGGYVLAYLARLLSSLVHRCSVTVIDGDTVAKHNLERQNFIQKDLNKNKAEVLATRYNNVCGLCISYLDQYIEDADTLLSLLSDHDNVMPIIIGCVDNNKTRQVLHEVFERANNLIYLDSGNTVRKYCRRWEKHFLTYLRIKIVSSKAKNHVHEMRTPLSSPCRPTSLPEALYSLICTHCLNLVNCLQHKQCLMQ